MKFTRFGLKLFCLFLLVSLVPSGIAGAVVYKYTYDKAKEDILGQLQYEVHRSLLYKAIINKRFIIL